jgi:hypothetical protein
VTSKIDESISRPWFKKGNVGEQNTSIRVIIGMSITKEGLGCSDEELFEKCQFDLLVCKDRGAFLSEEKGMHLLNLELKKQVILLMTKVSQFRK